MPSKQSELSTKFSSYIQAVSDISQHPAIISDLKTSISQAMQSPPVRQLINSGANVEGIEQVLAVMVLKYAKMLHIGGTIGTDEPRTIAKMLIQEYPLNSLDDFNIMFLRGVTGRYGKVMGFDISVIFGWAMMFQDEWASEREKLMDKVIEPEKSEPPFTRVPDVDKLLNDFANSLRDSRIQDVPHLSKSEIRKEGQTEPPKKKALAYTPNPELIIQHERKIAWMRECFDPLTGKPNDKYVKFEFWKQ